MSVSNSLSQKENLLKAIRFEKPDYIPMTFHINEACFHSYQPDDLFELMEQHPFLFPNFQKSNYIKHSFAKNARRDHPYTDDFGCIWKTTTDGIVGSVHDHPLSDWENYKTYLFPNPEYSTGLESIDWIEFEQNCQIKHDAGEIVYGSLRHGHTFLQLCDLRGYENLLFDMMDEEPLLSDLISKLETFNLSQISHFLKANVDIIRIPEDLGMQRGPMLSVDNFLKYIYPTYQHLITASKQGGKIVHMHSDGDIRLLANYIIDAGVDIFNIQDLVNGIDWICENLKGRVCVDLDIDRQSITPFGSPAQIHSLIREEVAKIGSKDGGLTMIYGLYPGVPLKNVKAVMDAMEQYAFYYN